MEQTIAGKPLLNKQEMVSVLKEIDEFAESPKFKALIKELRDLPSFKEKQKFVRDVIINPEEHKKRGIVVPEGMKVQRSYFWDNRPTLFCIVKYLKDGKRKMTWTFDDDNNFN